MDRARHYSFLTSKERDDETGLDYFGARYYNSTAGRFTSADEIHNDISVANPASWNRYAYVSNNPLRYIDPDGRVKQDAKKAVFIATEKPEKYTFLERSMGSDGKRYTISWEHVKGYIIAEDGKTKIEAYKVTGPMKVIVEDSNGKKKTGGAELLPISYDHTENCHGRALAGGGIWIPHDQVKKLMKANGYDVDNPTNLPKPNDIGLFSGTQHPFAEHSITVKKTDPVTGKVTEVDSKGGIEMPESCAPEESWDKPEAELKFYTKREEPKKQEQPKKKQ